MTRDPDTTLSRRGFLRFLGAASIGTILTLESRSIPFSAADPRALNVLVVGDSLIWGQGLREDEKTYSLVTDWLRRDAFGDTRKVDLKIKAHSGSTLKFHPEDAEKYKKVGREETYYYHPEINVAMPSIWKQIEVAGKEYKAAGASGADVILVSGSLPDISVEGILDPKGKDTELRADIKRYCHDDMLDVLRFARVQHPDAIVAVTGYFTMVSPKTNSSRLLNGWLESMSFPRFLKPFVNNPVVRALYFKRIRRKVQERSKLWFEESSRAIAQAVEDINQESGARRAVFVPSPITDDTSFETPNSLLFGLRHNHPDDPLFIERAAACRQTLPRLKKETRISVSTRYCEIAAVGHPTAAGSKAYFDAVQKALAPLLTRVRT